MPVADDEAQGTQNGRLSVGSPPPHRVGSLSDVEKLERRCGELQEEIDLELIRRGIDLALQRRRVGSSVLERPMEEPIDQEIPEQVRKQSVEEVVDSLWCYPVMWTPNSRKGEGGQTSPFVLNP